MANDPRNFTVKYCPKEQNKNIKADKDKSDFFSGISGLTSNLGAIGDIEALNQIGLSGVGSGLRTLAKLSDSIRTGDTQSAIIPNSEGYVLDAVGINPNAAQQAGKFNPGVLNRATAQATSVLNSVKSGNFKLTDIPNVATDFQNLSSLIGGIYNDGSDQRYENAVAKCGASPYAIDLIRYAPKYKFLFIVQITLSPEYISTMGDSAKQLAFVVKTSTRPNVNIEHEEVNMYNFWTRIPKRAIYEPITMRFYDDNKGLAHLFYTAYLRNISPISGFNPGSDLMDVHWLQANSMKTNSSDVAGTASLRALEGNRTSLIKEIKLFHVYDYGKMMNVYRFQNPKLLTMNLDDLDMAESATGNEIELQFGYDALYINPAFSIADNIAITKDVSGGSVDALYPINATFSDSDIVQTPIGIDADGSLPLPDITNSVQSVFDAGQASIAKGFQI